MRERSPDRIGFVDAGRLLPVCRSFDWQQRHETEAPLAPEMVVGQIRGNAVQPAPQLQTRTGRTDCAVGAQEGVLGQVLRQLAITAEAPQIPADGLLVGKDQGGKRLAVTSLRTCDELHLLRHVAVHPFCKRITIQPVDTFPRSVT